MQSKLSQQPRTATTAYSSETSAISPQTSPKSSFKSSFWRCFLPAFLLFLIGISGFGIHMALADEIEPPTNSGYIAGPVRLHVIANSDSATDQALKLQVRDAIVHYLTPKLDAVTSQAEAAEIVISSQEELTAIANAIVAERGYQAQTMFGIYPFPEKQYGEVTMPAGNYKALKIVLGEGKGKNWWCVLFPPLCFVEEASEIESAPASLCIWDLEQENFAETIQVQLKLKMNEIFYITR